MAYSIELEGRTIFLAAKAETPMGDYIVYEWNDGIFIPEDDEDWDSDDDEDDGTDGVSDDEIDELGQAMTDAGFSNEEIQNVINLVKDAGSMDAALKILKGIGENAGIDWSDFED